MAKTHTILEVFIASPGDVAPEREVLESIVDEFNLTWGDKHGVRLELLKWETHTRPSVGSDPQAVINEQIGDDFDIFLGIMWGKFGTATERGDSGTEEEFNRAIERHTTAPGSVQIMFYFKDAGIAPSKLDGEQIEKVKAFKKRVGEECGGLYYQFESTEQFKTKARIHLSKAVQDWLEANSTDSGEPTVTDAEPVELPETEFNPLGNLDAVDDDDAEDGIIELVDMGAEAMESVVDVLEKMAVATRELGERFQQRTDEINKLTQAAPDGKPDRKATKRVANAAADDLELFVQRMAVEVPNFYEKNTFAMESFGKVALISTEDFVEDPDEIAEAKESLTGYKDAITSSAGNLVTFRDTTKSMPRMTTAFNRARRRAVAILDDMLEQLNIASTQADDILELLDRMHAKALENAQ